jgi:microcystin-dependent protein
MSQYDFGTIDPYVVDGVQLADMLNQWRTALYSMHRGSARPSYAIPGMWWINDSAGASNWVVNVYFGPTVGDRPVFTYDTTTGAIALAIGAGGSVSGAMLQALDNTAPTVDWKNPTNPIDQKEFKVWLTTSGQLRFDVINDAGTATTAFQVERDGSVPLLIPPGTIWSYAGTAGTVPTPWFLCDGAVKSRTTEARLFAAIGTAWNTGGEAGTDFRLPDLRGRVAAGMDGGSNRLTSIANALGATGGGETHTLTAAQMPAHVHTASGNTALANIGTNFANVASTGAIYIGYGGVDTDSRGGGGSHPNVQPTAVMNMIIKR